MQITMSSSKRVLAPIIRRIGGMLYCGGGGVENFLNNLERQSGGSEQSCHFRGR